MDEENVSPLTSMNQDCCLRHIVYYRREGKGRHIHCNGNEVILTKFSSLAPSEVAKMTTFGAAGDENFIKMTTYPVQHNYDRLTSSNTLRLTTVTRHVRWWLRSCFMLYHISYDLCNTNHSRVNMVVPDGLEPVSHQASVATIQPSPWWVRVYTKRALALIVTAYGDIDLNQHWLR